MTPSDPLPPGPRSALGRRGALAAAALALPVLAAGCKDGLAVLGAPPRPLPDVAVLRRAISRERLMIARYQAVLASSPSPAPLLPALLAEHRAHLAGLRARLLDPSAGRPPAAAATPPPPPTTPRAALAYLREAEMAASADLLDGLSATPASLAQLLASIAASEATHAALLYAHGRRG